MNFPARITDSNGPEWDDAPVDVTDQKHIEALQAENTRLRAAIVAWAKRYQWGVDSWKREPENAALFAIAGEALK